MKRRDICIGGPAGAGIESFSHTLALSCTREGLHILTNGEYENRIRGGHNTSSVHIGETEILSHTTDFDIVLAVDKASVLADANKVRAGGVMLYDSDLKVDAPANGLGMPLTTLTKELGFPLGKNVILLGALYALLEKSLDTPMQVLHDFFARKGEKVVETNQRALQMGYDYGVEHFVGKTLPLTAEGDAVERCLMGGNEAIALGCIRAGMKLLAAYPMTPGSTILTTLAKEAQKYDMVVMHVEDEIAAVNMAIGAGYAGVRAATSTSGGGFALKVEAIGLAGQMEVPVVIFNAQRPGPSTGLPTKTAQGDLRMVVNAGQGDAPKIVIGLGTHEEAVRLTAEAFQLAERFQLPVIVLTEKYLADSAKSCAMDIANFPYTPDRGKILKSPHDKGGEGGSDFQRYALTEDGVSPRSVPGMEGAAYPATSYEHDEAGQGVEDPELVQEMMEKREKKMQAIEAALPEPECTGEGEVLLCTFGATKNAVKRAQEMLAQDGIQVQHLHLSYLYPLKVNSLEKLFLGKKVVFVEGNQTGQLEALVRQHLPITPMASIRKYDGEPMSADWIVEQLKKIL